MIFFIIAFVIALFVAFIDDLTPVASFFAICVLGSVIAFFINVGISGPYDEGSHIVDSKPVKDVKVVVVNSDKYVNDMQIEVTFEDSTKRQFTTRDTQLVIKPGAASYVRTEPNDPSLWLSVFPAFKPAENIITTPTAPSFKE
jgi:hypothetical protein